MTSSTSTLAVPVPFDSPAPLRDHTDSKQAPPRLSIQTQLSAHSHSQTPSPIDTPAHLAQMPSFSLVGAIEFRHVVSGLQNQATGSSLNIFDSPVAPYAGGHYHCRPSRSGSRSPRRRIGGNPEVEQWEPGIGVPLNDRSPRLFRASIIEDREREEAELPSMLEEGGFLRTPRTAPTVPSISRTPASPSSLDASTDVEWHPPLTRWQKICRVLSQTGFILFPSLHHFKSKNLLGKVAALFAAPAVMALTLTLPVVVMSYESIKAREEKIIRHQSHDVPLDAHLPEFEEEGVARELRAEVMVQEDLHEMKFNKWLMAAQCILGPLFCVAVLFSEWPLVAIKGVS